MNHFTLRQIVAINFLFGNYDQKIGMNLAKKFSSWWNKKVMSVSLGLGMFPRLILIKTQDIR